MRIMEVGDRGRNEEGSGEGKVEDLELTSEKEGAVSIIRMISGIVLK